MTDVHIPAAVDDVAPHAFDAKPGHAYLFNYVNHRGDRATRHVIMRALRWGVSPWHHDKTQWFVEGFCLDRREQRLFALAEINARSWRRLTDTELALLLAPPPTRTLHVVFDGPPGPEAGRFVECEDAAGQSLSAGEWRDRGDGFWELLIPNVGVPA